MSLNRYFYGVNKIEDFKNMFGLDDAKLAQVLFENYENWRDLDSDNEYGYYEESREKDLNIVKNAVINGGEAAVDLEYYHELFIRDSILNQPNTIDTYSEIDRDLVYFSKIAENLEGEPKKLIEYFANGRKIFSEGPTDSEFPYAYLNIEEMKILLNDIDKNWEIYDDNSGFIKDFIDCLKEFISCDKDLFCYMT